MGSGASLEAQQAQSGFAPVLEEVEYAGCSGSGVRLKAGPGREVAIYDGGLSLKGTAYMFECETKGVGGNAYKVNVTTVKGNEAAAEGSQLLVLFLHGTGKDRCGAFFGAIAQALVERTDARIDVIAVDFPGHGQSSSQRLPSNSGVDGDIVISLLRSFGASKSRQACCYTSGGGAGTFFRAFTKAPQLFAANHVLQNPIVALEPTVQAVSETILAHGCGFLSILCEGWSADDTPFAVASCGQFFKLLDVTSGCAERISVLTHRHKGSSSTVKGPMNGDYIAGRKVFVKGVACGDYFYTMTPSEQFVTDLLEHLEQPRAPAVDVAQKTGATLPTQTLIERSGKVNENFKVFLRVRPMLARVESRDEQQRRTMARLMHGSRSSRRGRE